MESEQVGLQSRLHSANVHIIVAVVFSCLAGQVSVCRVAAQDGRIVGHYAVEVPGTQSFNLASVQLDASDPTLLGVFGTDQLQPGVIQQFADKVYLRMNGDYRSYGLKSGTGKFYRTDLFHDDVNGPTNPPLPSGTAMWLQSRGGTGPEKTVTIAGEAVSRAVITNEMAAGEQLMAFPFSCGTAINDMALVSQGTAAGLHPQQGDELWVWHQTGYRAYSQYNTYVLKDNGTHPRGFYRLDEFFGASPTMDTIPVGGAFWYVARNAFTWVEDNPYLAAYTNVDINTTITNVTGAGEFSWSGITNGGGSVTYSIYKRQDLTTGAWGAPYVTGILENVTSWSDPSPTDQASFYCVVREE